MGTVEVFVIVGSVVAITATVLAAITGRIAYKYRTEIQQAEQRRAIRILRVDHTRHRAAENASEEKDSPALAGVGR